MPELRFDLNVDYDDLPGETKAAKTRELVQLMGRRGQLDALESWLKGGRNVRSQLQNSHSEGNEESL